MSDWSHKDPAGRRPGAAAGVRFEDPWAAAEQDAPLRRRVLDLVARRTAKLLVVALAPVFVLAFVWSIAPSSDEHEASAVARSAEPAEPTATAPIDPTRRAYAVALPALRGLPEDAAPGTRLDLWVAWDRRVKTERRIQHLLDDVRLERIVPPSAPGSSPAALLSVPEQEVADLLYGDLWGDFAVTIRK